MKEVFKGVFTADRRICTINSTPGYRVYDEKLIKDRGKEFRLWDPNRSKVAAAIAKGLKSFPVNEKSHVLYLGASSGTTASHIADIAEKVYCVEFSKRMMRELLQVCAHKKNMIPLLADARHPWEYANLIGRVDVAIQDVAQPNQAQILNRNFEQFDFKHAMLSIKARSISSATNPKVVFKRETATASEKFQVLESISLEPFEEDHLLLNLRAK